MRMSCNGCRVLRKGCSDDCPIRPCLRWIKTSQSQANATVFLAKFYGRAGLINILNSGPDHLRPAIFKSLLYDACGRIINPIYGSTGLLWSGSWQLCQEAVQAVLSGSPITRIASDSAVSGVSPPLQACDIRHVPKVKGSGSASHEKALHKVRKPATRFKRSACRPKVQQMAMEEEEERAMLEPAGSGSHESGLSEGAGRGCESDTLSVETVDASTERRDEGADDGQLDVELELTLGFEPTVRRASPKRRELEDGLDGDTCRLRVGFDTWQ